MTANRFDIIVIGGGMAGMSAATRASELGLRAVVLDRVRLDLRRRSRDHHDGPHPEQRGGVLAEAS